MIETMRVEGLCKSVGGVMVVDRMHFYLMQGEILGIIGLYDSGRSTLAKVLGGIVPATSGTIFLEGKPVIIADIAGAHRQGIFCVRNKSTLIPDLTVIENMCLLSVGAANMMHFPDRKLEAKAKVLLEAMGIDVNPRTMCRELSLPVRHQIEICRAFFCNAKALVIDDIANTYAQREQDELSRLLLWIKRKGMSVILTGSRAEQMVTVCDRIVTMRRGRESGLYFREEFSVSTIEKALLGEERKKARPMVRVDHSAPVLRMSGVASEELKDISFSLYPGEVVGFADRRGRMAGAIVDLFNGKKAPVKGIVELNGEVYTQEKSIESAFKNHIGYMEYYKNGIFPRLSLLENMTIASLENYSSGVHISNRLERFAVREYFKSNEVFHERLDDPMSSYNSLIQMNVSLHRWMLKKVRILVMNDVFSGTDILMRNSLDEFIRLAQEKGMGIVLISTDIADLRRVCTRICVIHEGTIVSEQMMGI